MSREEREPKSKEEIDEQQEAQEQDTQDDSVDNESKEQLEACQKELEEQKEKYLRAYADFENMKKRLERDKSSAVSFANETFAKDLLSVIDSFESAISSMEQIEGDEAVNKIKEGVSLTFEQLLKVMKKHGVEEVANEGVFDPNFHQAIQQVDSDVHESGEIVNVLQKGYLLKDRLLRPAIVTTKK